MGKHCTTCTCVEEPVVDKRAPNTCNRHNDCAAADAKAKAIFAAHVAHDLRYELYARPYTDHCYDDCCEDCFGS